MQCCIKKKQSIMSVLECLLTACVRHHITLVAHCDAIKYAVRLGAGDQTGDPSEIWMSSLRTFYTVSCNPFHYTETENGCQRSFTIHARGREIHQATWVAAMELSESINKFSWGAGGWHESHRLPEPYIFWNQSFKYSYDLELPCVSCWVCCVCMHNVNYAHLNPKY